MSIYVDKNLYDGRPKSNEGLTSQELDSYDLLDRLDIKYQRSKHEPANTIEDCLLVEEVIGVRICKNLFLTNRQQTEFYLLMMPGDKPFKTAVVSKLLKTSRLSFAKPDLLLEKLNLSPGSVTILGLMYDKDKEVQLVIDREILDSDHIRCHPCKNTATLKIKTSDMMDKILNELSHKPIIIDIPREI